MHNGSFFRVSALLFLAVSMAGCATNQGIVKLGSDSYTLYKEDHAGVFGNATSLRNEVINEANTFAGNQGKIALPIAAKTHHTTGRPADWETFEYQFRLIDKNDSTTIRTHLISGSDVVADDTGKIVREVKVASEPEALLAVLNNPAYHFKRIGLEAGPLSQWLFGALAEAELPVVCVETRHMQAVLKAQINKTDRNDARGIAQMMRVGLYRPVHVKTLRSQKLRMLLTHRKLLQSKAIAIENDLRGTLRNFGLKVGMVGKVMTAAAELLTVVAA